MYLSVEIWEINLETQNFHVEVHAKIIRCLDIIHSNISFSGARGNSEKFKQFFPDSIIVNVYQQNAVKLKFMVQFWRAPCIKKIICIELKNFTPHFDEATTS